MPPVAADRQGGQDKSPNPRSCRMRAFARCLAALSVVAATLVATDLAVVPAAQAAGTTVTVTDGGAPGWVRFDDQGNGVDAHDGEIKQFGKTYYLYGTAYGCGYVRLHGYFHDTQDRKSTRLNSSHANISYAVFCLNKK